MRYLLDTNIVIFWLKKRYYIGDKITEVGESNCYVSDVTVAELCYGVECSASDLIEHKRRRLDEIIASINVIPFAVAIDYYAKEKARLRTVGEMISDFDLLVGATAVQQNMTMVSNNVKHLSKIRGIDLIDWTLR